MLIGRLGRRGNVGHLVSALERLSGEEIVAFHELLHGAVTALDTAAHREQPVADVSGGSPEDLSEDVFEDVRLSVVAAGRERWAAAVVDPAVMAGVWPLGLGEALGRVAAGAYEAVTGDPWPEPGLMSPPTGVLPPAARHNWLMLMLPEGEAALPAAYREWLEWLDQKLNQLPWQQWWDAGRGDESSLVCRYESGRVDRPRSSLRVGADPTGRVEVTVAIRFPPVHVQRPDLDPAGDRERWVELAGAHVQLLFDVLQSKLGLDPPPDLPSTAELERERRQAEEREIEEATGFAAWNHERTTAVPLIWAGRLPRRAVNDLITTLENGGRRQIPGMIAAMRAQHAIPATSEDERLLAHHGYSPEEISIALD